VTGTLPTACYAAGITKFLYAIGVCIFDYPQFASTLRDRVRERAASLAAEAGITIEHIAKSHIRKEAVVAEVLKRRGETHHAADADATRLRQGFEASGDVDPVAKDVVAIDDDVAEIDADTEFNAPFRRHTGIPLGDLPLHVDRTAHGVDDAGELNQKPVAGCFDDAAAMLDDPGIDQFAPDGFQCRKRAFLVCAHRE
jgi:hypothetical protein